MICIEATIYKQGNLEIYYYVLFQYVTVYSCIYWHLI